MTVELLYWDGCPSHPEALAQLRRILEEEGVAASVDLLEVETDEQAEQQRFIGSPTIRIDGEDVIPAREEAFSLSCRVYRTRDGQISPLPDPEDVRAAIRRAA
jgi:ubiquinone/menaquinone biosynthesis C-methylase UbiE